jgi:hypothetical protein
VLNAGLILPGRKVLTCSVALTTHNVTGDNQIALSASREDGSAGISLSQPIVGELELLNGNTTGALDVTVQMRLPGSTTPLALYARGEAAPHDFALLAILGGRALVPHRRLGQRHLLLLLRPVHQPAHLGAARRLGRGHDERLQELRATRRLDERGPLHLDARRLGL